MPAFLSPRSAGGDVREPAPAQAGVTEGVRSSSACSACCFNTRTVHHSRAPSIIPAPPPSFLRRQESRTTQSTTAAPVPQRTPITPITSSPLPPLRGGRCRGATEGGPVAQSRFILLLQHPHSSRHSAAPPSFLRPVRHSCEGRNPEPPNSTTAAPSPTTYPASPIASSPLPPLRGGSLSRRDRAGDAADAAARRGQSTAHPCQRHPTPTQPQSQLLIIRTSVHIRATGLPPMHIPPKRRRRILNAHHLRQQGQSLRKIAEQLHVSHATIRADLQLVESHWSELAAPAADDLLLNQLHILRCLLVKLVEEDLVQKYSRLSCPRVHPPLRDPRLGDRHRAARDAPDRRADPPPRRTARGPARAV